MGSRATRWAAALAGLALAATACGGSDPEVEDDQQLDVGGVATVAPDVTDAPEGEAEDEPDPPPAEPEDATDDGDAADAVRPGLRQPVKVTYGGSSLDDGTLTLVYDVDRFAIHFEDGRVIQTETETIFCGAPGEPCLSSPSAGGGADGFAGGMGGFLDFSEALEDGDALPPSWRRSDDRTIAGRQAACAEFDPNDLVPGSGDGTASYCFDRELGVGLSWTFVGPDGEETMEATAVTTPTEDDFTPTGPVESFDAGS